MRKSVPKIEKIESISKGKAESFVKTVSGVPVLLIKIDTLYGYTVGLECEEGEEIGEMFKANEVKSDSEIYSLLIRKATEEILKHQNAK